jgi:hypothetical protein
MRITKEGLWGSLDFQTQAEQNPFEKKNETGLAKQYAQPSAPADDVRGVWEYVGLHRRTTMHFVCEVLYNVSLHSSADSSLSPPCRGWRLDGAE